MSFQSISTFEWNEQRLEAAKLFAEGAFTQVEIAAELQITDRTLRNWLAEPRFQAEVDRVSMLVAGVSEDIRRRMQNAAQHTITRGQIIGRLCEVANASLIDFVDDDGGLDIKKARASKKGHLIKEITVVERHSKDGSKRVTKSFKIDSPTHALDILTEIYGLKKQAAQNPLDLAKEMLGILRDDPKFADMDQSMLRSIVARRLNVAETDLVSDANN